MFFGVNYRGKRTEVHLPTTCFPYFLSIPSIATPKFSIALEACSPLSANEEWTTLSKLCAVFIPTILQKKKTKKYITQLSLQTWNKGNSKKLKESTN